MPFFDECCVLIPAATLEDFPSDLADSDARSLLAAWTLLWHPALLAASQQIPAWYRADAPPDPIGPRLLTVATPCQSLLPDGWEERSRNHPDCCWVSGEDRQSMLQDLAQQLAKRSETAKEAGDELGIDPRVGQDWPRLEGEQRSIGVEDFYAAGYAALQVQVMTRRLRYTSNLDEIHLQTRLVAAAKAFVANEAQAAIDALHDVFDSLAEERDHYFSSDPHLVDLTLAVPSTVESLLENFAPPSTESGAISTPTNVLIDADTASALAATDDSRREQLVRWIVEGQVGWAGGGPTSDVCLDTMTYADAEAVFVEAWRTTTEAMGASPLVYGRFSGSTPSDLTRTLSTLGYVGVIPLDFASGTGHGDEAKVILQAGGTELEALTVQPMDAGNDASFLTLGTKLGEAIDGGEIATALLAHWPGQRCDAFDDVRRTASWSLVLGRFWKIDDYFTEGERPYHHGSTQTGSSDSHQLLDRCVEAKLADPVSSPASSFRERVIQEQSAVLRGMTSLVTGGETDAANPAAAFAAAVTGKPANNDRADSTKAQAILAVNPHASGVRHPVTISGGSPKDAKHVFATSSDHGRCTALVDIPGCGFVVVRGEGNRGQSTFGNLLKGKLLGGSKVIAEADVLKNEFMEVAISEQSGGIAGVYSGSARGNRLSMRLIRNRAGLGSDDQTAMKCDSFSASNSGTASGWIEASGCIVDTKSDSPLATFKIRYTLRRGSRFLEVDGEVTPSSPITGAPWYEYIGARVAVVTESAICHSLVRDKLHRARGKRFVSPLGMVIDEAERQTLITANGSAFYRRAGDRFFDTLLMVEGETKNQFSLRYGFDVPNPVAASRALVAPPLDVPVDKQATANEIGWIVHVSSKEILVTTLRVARRADGKLAAIVRCIQTRGQATKAKLRFFRDVEFAVTVDGTADTVLDQPRGEDDDPSMLPSQGDAVKLSIGGHGIADLLVVFTD